MKCGPGSVVGIATGYGVDGSGIESRWGQIFRTCLDRPWGPPRLLYNGYWLFAGVKSGRGVTLAPHTLLVPWSRKGRAIPLLLLCAVRSVQSLSPCARVHITPRSTDAFCLTTIQGQKKIKPKIRNHHNIKFCNHFLPCEKMQNIEYATDNIMLPQGIS